MLTIAFIGNGKSANRYHLPFIQKIKDIRVKTIYSRSQSPWPAIPGVSYTHEMNEILDDPEIQLVVLSVPVGAHFDLAKTCLLAGKHVLVEKPFTESYAQAKELFQLAKDKGLVIQAYQNRRFDSDFLTVKKVMAEGQLGDLLELEMHFDYYRPEIPEGQTQFSLETSYLYGHACHTLDQVISLFGQADQVHFDVRQLLGSGRMNDYFDIDLYYGPLKVSVKSSYFRIKERPSFVLYGKKGMFIKAGKDRQEADLKRWYMPDQEDFGLDRPEDYGCLTYVDDQGRYHEEKVISEVGDYSRFYQALHDCLIFGADKPVPDQETLYQMQLLEEGIRQMKES